MTGPVAVFDGRFGLINTHLGNRARFFDRLVANLGEDWECMKTSFKPYPCGHLIHQFLDAVLHLRAKHGLDPANRSEEHTSELQSLLRISYAVFCLKKKTST